MCVTTRALALPCLLPRNFYLHRLNCSLHPLLFFIKKISKLSSLLFSAHPTLVFPLLLSSAPLPSPPLPSTALRRPISSSLLGTGSAPPLLVLTPPLAPFGQIELNRGYLFGHVWSNKSHSVWPDRPGGTEALHSVKQNRTKALRSALFGRTMPKSAEDRREPVPRSGEEMRAKRGYWEKADAGE